MSVAGAHTDPADHGWELSGLDPELARDWHVWSVVLGRTLLPVLEPIRGRLPRLVSAMVCTADGFNLCALNTDEHQVTRMAALTSSLFGLASAHGEVTQGPESPPAHTLIMENGNQCTVIVGRPQELIGHAVLQVVTENTTLGQALVAAKATLAEICSVLDTE